MSCGLNYDMKGFVTLLKPIVLSAAACLFSVTGHFGHAGHLNFMLHGWCKWDNTWHQSRVKMIRISASL